MIDYDTQLVAALSDILPTHYEMNLHRGLPTPCISYQEDDNYDKETGDTFGYSGIRYIVKVWGNDIATIKEYVGQIDKTLRPLGFKRMSSGELYDKNSTMIQKILTYEATALEEY
jgi:hypothetical protein